MNMLEIDYVNEFCHLKWPHQYGVSFDSVVQTLRSNSERQSSNTMCPIYDINCGNYRGQLF